MAKTGQKRPGRPILVLDSDLLGFASATFVAAVAATLGFWVGQDLFTVAVRAGWSFLITYAVVFLLVHTILRTTIREMVERRKREEEARKAAKAAEQAQAPVDKGEGAGET